MRLTITVVGGENPRISIDASNIAKVRECDDLILIIGHVRAILGIIDPSQKNDDQPF